MNHRFSHRLTSLLSARRSNERGAVAVMTAIILAFTLTGVGALAVDTGVLYTERHQAQNGADAAALSVANSCATSTKGCGPTSGDPSTWAQDNAKTSMAGVSVTPDGVCGSPSSGMTNICGSTGDTAKLPDCPTLPSPAPAKYVEVHTRADNAVHGFIIRGNEHPAACSRVAWGAPKSFTLKAPLAFSMCDWKAMITNAGYADPPPYASPVPTSVTSHETAIVVNDPGQSTDSNGCARWAGHVLPGGFGYLNATGDCELKVTDGDWVKGEPGASVPSTCGAVIQAALKGQTLLIPVFDCVSDNSLVCPKAVTDGGNGVYYHIAGVAAFYVSGSTLPSFGKAPLSSATRCPSGQKCLYGWFTQATLSTGQADLDGGGTDYGVKIIQMVG